MVTVSIVLPTYNRGHLLNACVERVLQQSLSDFELIIIDDGSRDETARVVKNLIKSDSRIKFFKNDVNKGLPFSRNKSIRLSKGKFIFFIEDDLLLDKNCVQTLYRTFDDLRRYDIKVGAVGPRVIEKHPLISQHESEYVVKKNNFTGMVSNNFSINTRKIVEVPTLRSCSLITKDVFRKIGGYNEVYKGTHFREETDFYYRARKLDYKLFFQPKAVTHHQHDSIGGIRQPNLIRTFYEVRNHIIFLARSYGLKSILMIPCYFGYLVSRLKNIF